MSRHSHHHPVRCPQALSRDFRLPRGNAGATSC